MKYYCNKKVLVQELRLMINFKCGPDVNILLEELKTNYYYSY